MITRLSIAAAVALFFTPTMSIFAQEHPEHPTKTEDKKKGEHPEHPKKGSNEEKVTKAEISAGIKKHIADESKKSSDKKFHVSYEGEDLALDLVKVHDDRLSKLDEGKYFACVDLKATNGKTYDVDFFLSGKPDDMKVTETSVHKIEGKPLYNWKEENGVWKKVST
jgi:SHS2 domain-containing protein